MGPVCSSQEAHVRGALRSVVSPEEGERMLLLHTDIFVTLEIEVLAITETFSVL